jgi:hypothetical protein
MEGKSMAIWPFDFQLTFRLAGLTLEISIRFSLKE